jgi:hypothetical protein
MAANLKAPPQQPEKSKRIRSSDKSERVVNTTAYSGFGDMLGQYASTAGDF